MALPRGERQVSKSKYLAQGLGKSSCIEFQGVSETLPKPNFEPLEHSVKAGSVLGATFGSHPAVRRV